MGPRYNLREPETNDLLEFYELTHDLHLDSARSILYPRIVCDISAPVSRSTGALKVLSVYSNSTGTAAGIGVADAFRHGLNEVIERDAESKFLLDVNMENKSHILVQLPSGPWQAFFDEVTGGYGKGGALLMLNSVAGYVFCAVSSPRNGEGQIGLGSSQFPDVAVRRALTELRQYQVATEDGASWEDDGGLPLDNLTKYPNMRKIASRVFDVGESAELTLAEAIALQGRRSVNTVDQLRMAGYTAYGRVLWEDTGEGHRICVTQALVPGLEYFSNIVYCRPMVPVGRCRSREVTDFLLSPQE